MTVLSGRGEGTIVATLGTTIQGNSVQVKAKFLFKFALLQVHQKIPAAPILPA
jgi:hypothetical protein